MSEGVEPVVTHDGQAAWPPGSAVGKARRQRRPTGAPPPELADAETVGVIYDEIDGLNFYNEHGMLRDLFADPALASDERYADVLRGYLRAETIGPLPFRRLAAAHIAKSPSEKCRQPK